MTSATFDCPFQGYFDSGSTEGENRLQHKKIYIILGMPKRKPSGTHNSDSCSKKIGNLFLYYPQRRFASVYGFVWKL